jgi:hypothetical protein
MACMNSFYITINNFNVYSGGVVQVWGTAPELYFFVTETQTSSFVIEGFKNINVYSIEMSGSCAMERTIAGGQNVVEDYGFFFNLTGLTPRVSGFVQSSPNYWNLNPTSQSFSLSKMNSKLSFETPIQSLKGIDFTKFYVSGYGAASTSLITIVQDLTFVINYKYEGED